MYFFLWAGVAASRAEQSPWLQPAGRIQGKEAHGEFTNLSNFIFKAGKRHATPSLPHFRLVHVPGRVENRTKQEGIRRAEGAHRWVMDVCLFSSRPQGLRACHRKHLVQPTKCFENRSRRGGSVAHVPSKPVPLLAGDRDGKHSKPHD